MILTLNGRSAFDSVLLFLAVDKHDPRTAKQCFGFSSSTRRQGEITNEES